MLDMRRNSLYARDAAHYVRVLLPLSSQMIFDQSITEPTARHTAYVAPSAPW
jgi:hypothetical protein